MLSTHDSQLLHVASLETDSPDNASCEDVYPFITALLHLMKERPFGIFREHCLGEQGSRASNYNTGNSGMNESSNQGTVNPGGFVLFCVSNIISLKRV